MSTRSLVTVAGGLIGAYFGYPQLGLIVGGLIGGAVDPATVRGPEINEVKFQTQAEGVPRIVPWGTVPCTGNVIQNGPLIKTTESSSQGKGSTSTETPTAYRTYAVAICEGPIRGVLSVKEDNKLVYDVRPGSLMLAESAKWAKNKFFRLGGEDQEPDPFLVFIDPETPAYRGTAFMTVVLEDVTARGGSIPQYQFEVSTTVAPAETGADWFDSVQYVGNGSSVSLSTLNLTDGGLVWVTRTDSGETPMMFYQVGTGSAVYQMENVTVAPGGTVKNPVASSASFLSAGITLPSVVSTSGGQYIAYVFKKSTGNFDISPYVGTGATTQVVPHSLGTVPKMHFVRQFDDPAATLGYMHLAHFNGLQRLFMGDDANAATVNLWGNTAPTTSGVTVGNSTAINGSGRNYVMFLFGGDDCDNRQVTVGADMNIGFDPSFAYLKRRAGGSPFRYNLLTGTPDPGFAGSELLTYAESAGGVASTEDRLTRVTDGVYQISAVGGASGTWVGLTVDAFMIKGTSTVPPLSLTLADIVSDIHRRCGIATSLRSVAELTDQVTGFSAGSAGYTGADAIDALRPIYAFDKSDHDGKLWYPKRGKAVVKTLTIDNLTEIPDTSQREQASELPYKLNLQYQHAASNYAVVKATAPGTPTPDRRTTGEVSMQTSVVLDENQAAQAADKIYKITLAEAGGTIELSVPLCDAADLADADCVGLYLRGRTRRLRIEQSALMDWTVKFTLRNDRQSAYTSAVTGIPIPLPTLPPSTIVGDTELAIMDISARTDSEDDLSVIVGVSGAMPAWHGTLLQRSTDGGASYSSVEEIDTASVMGVLVASVPAASSFFTDRTNSVRVMLYRPGQTLDTLTDTQFLSRQGACAVENADGTWEVMQYRDANLEMDGSFTLTTLHRGQLNTGGSAHSAGARFVLLDTAEHVPTSASYLGLGLTHRAITIDETADDTTNDTTRAFVGRSQLEWPVASFALSRSGNNVTGTWAPRHRFGSDDAPVASSNFQGYRVTIVGTGTITFDTTSSTFTQDVSAIGGAVTVSVSAINRITGAGPATSGAI